MISKIRQALSGSAEGNAAPPLDRPACALCGDPRGLRHSSVPLGPFRAGGPQDLLPGTHRRRARSLLGIPTEARTVCRTAGGGVWNGAGRGVCVCVCVLSMARRLCAPFLCSRYTVSPLSHTIRAFPLPIPHIPSRPFAPRRTPRARPAHAPHTPPPPPRDR